jgi:TRAP-type uncharacterized transport system fused permease subunit
VGFGSSDRLEGAYGTAVSTTMLLTTAMVVLTFIFGAILGTGPPPAPTYILVAIVIAPPLARLSGRGRADAGRLFSGIMRKSTGLSGGDVFALRVVSGAESRCLTCR